MAPIPYPQPLILPLRPLVLYGLAAWRFGRPKYGVELSPDLSRRAEKGDVDSRPNQNSGLQITYAEGTLRIAPLSPFVCMVLRGVTASSPMCPDLRIRRRARRTSTELRTDPTNSTHRNMNRVVRNVI